MRPDQLDAIACAYIGVPRWPLADYLLVDVNSDAGERSWGCEFFVASPGDSESALRAGRLEE